jgi:hypothetical protein
VSYQIISQGDAMLTAFPQIRIGNPIRHDRLSIFPLFADPLPSVKYILGAEALADGTVVVEEVSESGSVPKLSVTNTTPFLVLFLEGEQLIGAKQNRILNTSILVAANSKATLPVSCVEQGRWRFKTKQFGSSDTCSPSKVRHALKASVSDSIIMGSGHKSDQGRVWEEVAKSQQRHGVSSETMAMEDTFDSHRDSLAKLQKQFGYVEGAYGVAVALGKQVVALDLFDKPATCQKVWNRLLSGCFLDSLVSEGTDELAETRDVEMLLTDLQATAWQSAAPAGEGEEFRAATKRGTQASALCYTGRFVHGSAVAAV